MRDVASHPNLLVLIPGEPLLGRIRLAGLRLSAWIEARAACAAEAALYQELSRLSDAELERRGFPRGELHRCISGDMTGAAGQHSRF